jgi:pSer/pThr/pTyr-binding forkhead associated (FHA) protein
VLFRSYASSRHARLYHHGGQYWLEDLQSTNGTFLNDKPVDMPIVLAKGDLVRIGSVTFQFVRWTYEMGPDH